MVEGLISWYWKEPLYLGKNIQVHLQPHIPEKGHLGETYYKKGGRKLKREAADEGESNWRN